MTVNAIDITINDGKVVGKNKGLRGHQAKQQTQEHQVLMLHLCCACCKRACDFDCMYQILLTFPANRSVHGYHTRNTNRLVACHTVALVNVVSDLVA